MHLIEEHCEHLRWRAVTASSIDARRRCLTRFARWLGRPSHEATLDELRAWLALHAHLAPRTRYGMVSHLGCYWRWLVLEGHVTTDPTIRIARPKLRRHLPRPVATADVRTALDGAPTAEVAAMVALAAFAGLRCCEISGLDRRDIHDRRDPPVIHVCNAKGGRERIVPMHPECERAALLRVQGGPLFDLAPQRVSRVLREHLHACGIAASAHQLRHWYATEIYRASTDLRLTQELLGHASPATTAIYTAWAQERAHSVVGLLAA